MERIIREFFTISSILWIITSEATIYLFLRDWPNFIKNLATKLASVNILYVKLFQAVASNNSLIDDKTNNELLRFTDNAPWSQDDIRFNELFEIADNYGLQFKNDCETPVNAGMISLVFKVYKRTDGSPVIIKMKRANIDTRLNNAIENLQTFLYLLSFIPFIYKYQISDVINKNIDIIRSQTNFNEEVSNILKVRNNCTNLKYVKIPYVYEEVTHKYPDYIVMEFIEGKKINEVESSDYIGFSKQVLKFGIVTTILHGVTHGDLHSGNILFIKDDLDEKYPHKIGVIDFGIIFEIEKAYKEALFEFFTQMFERPPRESVIHLLNSVIIDPPNIINEIPRLHYEGIVDIGTEIFTEAITNSKSTNQIQLYKFLSIIKDYLGKSELTGLGIKPSDNFVKTQLILAMAHGVTLTLCNNQLIPLIDDVLNELFHTKILLEDDY